MTDDFVKRLKRLSIEIIDREKHPYRWSDEFIAMKVNKAADCIEQLEAALRESYKFEETLMRISHLADQHPVFDDALKAYTRCASIARAALGEKKDV